MSMSTFIYGIIDKEKLEKAIQSRETLVKLGLDYPDELDNIIEKHIKIPLTKIPNEHSDIWEIDLKDIPENVTKIRFEQSY